MVNSTSTPDPAENYPVTNTARITLETKNDHPRPGSRTVGPNFWCFHQVLAGRQSRVPLTPFQD